MDKDKILEKSREENQPMDEREQQVSLKAIKAAYGGVLLANIGVMLLLFVQRWITGEAFMPWEPFVWPFFVSNTAYTLTLYRYHRRTIDLAAGLSNAAAAIIFAFVIFTRDP